MLIDRLATQSHQQKSQFRIKPVPVKSLLLFVD